MTLAIILIFILGYMVIALEHPLKLDKTVPALIIAAVMWALLAIGFQNGTLSIVDSHNNVSNFIDGALAVEGFKVALLHHVGKTAEVLIFLIGAMTIVELIDLHRGFEILKTAITTKSRLKVLWIVGVLAFFLSAIIDNLTATIVLVTLLRKLIAVEKRRMWYIGMVIIAANAGGAWSPIGDVTTTMLWISDKVTTTGLIKYVAIPSIVCFLVPFGLASMLSVFKGNVIVPPKTDPDPPPLLSSRTMLIVGLGAIVFVPIFKTITHLPPYLGMMLGLGVVWLISEYIHPEEEFSEERKYMYSAHNALSRIEVSSILFFLGILMAVGALETLVYSSINGEPVGTLRYLAEFLGETIQNEDVVVILLGIVSAVVDNVPMVAASIGMFNMPIDSMLWHFIAYSAGTGGSMLIIGSAAGVAAMGMEKIDFIWYMKKIGWLAAAGFFSGAATLLLLKYTIFL